MVNIMLGYGGNIIQISATSNILQNQFVQNCIFSLVTGSMMSTALLFFLLHSPESVTPPVMFSDILLEHRGTNTPFHGGRASLLNGDVLFANNKSFDLDVSSLLPLSFATRFRDLLVTAGL